MTANGLGRLVHRLRHPDDRALKRFADGASPHAERARVAAHLTRCGRCRATVAWMRDLAAAARRLEPVAPPAGMLERVLAERAAGERVILAAGGEPSAGRRPLPRRALAAAAVLAVTAGAAAVSLRGVRARPTPPAAPNETAELGVARTPAEGDSLPRLHATLMSLGVLPASAYAQEPTAPAGARPPRPRPDGARVRPGRWKFELRIDRPGAPGGAAERGIFTVAPVTFDIIPAWRVADAWTGHPHDLAETTYVARSDLRPLHRVAYNVGFSRYHVEQWFARDSLTGTMGAPTRPSRRIARPLPAASGPYLVGDAAPVLFLQAVRLHLGWSGRAALVGWGSVTTDLTYPIDLRVIGEERVRVPAGAFDCWKLRITAMGREQTTWIRKADQLAVMTRDATDPRAVRTVVLVSEHLD